MRFDDRLSTVLALSAEAPRDRVVQWRQLVELVARGAGASDPPLFQRALDRITALTADVPDPVRAVAARAIAGPNLPIPLVAMFLDRTEIAVPLLASADFGDAQWMEIRALAAPDVQELMDLIRPKAVQPAPEELAAVEPPPPQRESPALFRWECGPTGEIDWVEGAPRAALIGRSVADDFEQRFAARLPFSDEPLVLADSGAMAGEWRWSGTPAFSPATGRFAGYHGSARRGDPSALTNPARTADGKTALDSHRLRELIHELRTPLTAIMGFGEIIEGQILGPAHRAYRNRAGEIVRQARRLLAAVDDLDLAAKLQSSQSTTGEGTSVSGLLSKIVAELRPQFATRLVELYVRSGDDDVRIRLEDGLAERLLHRFIEAVGAMAEEGEELVLTVKAAGEQVGMALNCPRALRDIDEDELLDPGFSAGGEYGLGIGFALRLARGLAVIGGGGLTVARNQIVLTLPQR